MSKTDCKVGIESEDGAVKFIEAPMLDLSTEANFRLPADLSDASLALCTRASLILKTTDFLFVIEERKPLFLTGKDAEVVLEMVNGQFRMRVLKGKLSDQQIAAAQNAMNEAQSIHQDD